MNGGNSYNGTYFRQTENFDLADKKWTPIGSWNHPFKGHFDGDNHGIFRLNVDVTDWWAGLFGCILSGSIRNVRISSGSVKSTGSFVGGIVGELDGSQMENCTASVNVSGKGNVGGLVGNISGSTVSKCHFLSGEIIGSDDNIGGIVGIVQNSDKSTVSGCSANASMKGGKYVGGLCGCFCNGDHEFSNCTMKGSITVKGDSCGGLVGFLYDSKGKFENCRFEGSINGEVYVRGIAIGRDDCSENASKGVTFPGCECIIDAQTNTDLNGEKVGYIENKSADNEKERADNYDYSDITVTVKGDDTQN